MKESPHILQVIPSLVTGGAERGCIDMALAIIDQGGHATIVSEGGPMTKELEGTQVNHITLPVASKNPLIIYKNIGRLKKLIEENQIDLVHVRSRAPAWSCYYAAKQAQIPYLATFHAPYGISNRFKKLYNSIMARGDKMIAVSEFVKKYVMDNYGIQDRRIITIHRSIDPAAYRPGDIEAPRLQALRDKWRLPTDRKIILLPGRLTRWKGQTVFIEALSLIQDKGAIGLLVGGDQGRTDYRQELLDLAKKHNLQDRIILADHCDDMPAAYELSDIVVSASIQPEAFGRVIIEGQVMQKPVIVTEIGAAFETIKSGSHPSQADGATGWRIPPNDSQALAQAINEALGLSDDQLQNLGARARDHVLQNFTIQRMTSQIWGVYETLLS